VDARSVSSRARHGPRLAAAFLVLACATAAAAFPAPADAQAGRGSAALAPPAVLPEDVLRPPLVRAVSRVFRPAGDARLARDRAANPSLAAYAAYRDGMQDRARDLGRGPLAPSGPRRAEADRASRLDLLLTDLPGGELLQRGRSLLRQLDASTRLGLEGYRVQLRVGDALDGRLAIQAQKRLP
jgi:hypothetical protein